MSDIDLLALTGRDKDHLVQKVKNLSDVPSSKLTWPMMMTEKIDGVYCIVIKYNDDVGIFSRTGERYTSMKHIESVMMRNLDEGEVVIFEAYEPGKPQNIISGHCRDTKNQWTSIIPYCHQYMKLSEFIEGVGTTTAAESYEILGRIVWNTFMQRIESWNMYSLEQTMGFVREIWAKGGEGVVLRNPQGIFRAGKKTNDMIRIKRKITYDLEVLDVIEGRPGTKYVGMVGKLVLKFKDGKTVKVGSGLSDKQRSEWWNNRSLIIGKVVEVEAMKDSSKGVLREPRYLAIRHDKVKGDF